MAGGRIWQCGKAVRAERITVAATGITVPPRLRDQLCWQQRRARAERPGGWFRIWSDARYGLVPAMSEECHARMMLSIFCAGKIIGRKNESAASARSPVTIFRRRRQVS
jgi:hypothetical protein